MSFINVKCGGKIIASYTGVEIMTGVDKSNPKNVGATIIGVRQSAYNQMVVAKENFKWKKELKEDFDEHADDAPINETDFSAVDGFYKIPESLDELTTNPKTTKDLAGIAFIAACVGLILSFFKKKFGTIGIILAGISGFVSMFLMHIYVKVTLPETGSSGTFSDEYSGTVIKVLFAPGYWVALFLFLVVAIVGILKIRWQKKVQS